jgi:DNA polymerase III delta prime subunit
MNSDFIFVERYAPKRVEDCILPESIKNFFIEVRDSGKIPNMILSGPPGIGKTSTIKALALELDRDFMVINGSDERSIDVIRNKVKNYASTLSLSNTGKKILLIDEADNLTHDAQLALRASIEELQTNCTFIFTCNYKNKLIPPLHSRAAAIEFLIPPKEKPKLASDFMKRILNILELEKIDCESSALAGIINKYFPDFRRTLNEVQRYSSSGKLDSGILAHVSDVTVSSLIKHLKDKNFTEVRKWVIQNIDNDPNKILRKVYDSLYDTAVESTIPAAILVISKYQYRSAFVADSEINLIACLTEIMCEVEWK